MKTETAYRFIGGSWGTMLGIFTGFTISMALFNVLWSAYTGDASGQEGILNSSKAVSIALITVFGIAGLSTGHYLSRRAYKEHKKERAKKDKQKLNLLFIITIIFTVFTIITVYFFNNQLDINELRQQQIELRSIKDLDAFAKNRLKLAGIEPLIWKNGAGFDLKLEIAGKDAGDYLLKAIVYENKNKKVLFEYSETTLYTSKTTAKIIPVKYAAIIDAYLANVAGKNVKLPLKDKLGIVITLEPLLATKARPGYYYNSLRDVKYLELPLEINSK